MILAFSSCIIGLLALLELFTQREADRKGRNRFLEFAGALLLQNGLIYLSLRNPNYKLVALLGWAWPLKIFWSSFGDLRHQRNHRAFFFLSVFGGLYFLLALVSPFLLGNPLYLSLVLFSGLAVLLSEAALREEADRERIVAHANSLEKARTDKLVLNSKYSELGMMAAGIAHEINNPLAVIQARTTQLLRIYRDPRRNQELAEGLQQVLYTSERINRTIQGVREFVHDERTQTTEIRLKDLVDDVLAFCGQRMKNHGVSLRFYDLDSFSIWGNKIQVEQILLNLLNNAFDAIEFLPDKWIEISAQQNDDQVLIYVKDSGNGIPKEISSHIMEPFYSTKEVGKGTGLGLALARGIAEKHGGNLRYLDGLSHTTFVLELPRRPGEDWGLPMVH